MIHATCVFCNAEPATSKEHLLINALGGSASTKGLSCVTCNSRFGGTIDAALDHAFRYASIHIGALTGENEPVAGVPVTDSEGETWTIRADGKLVPTVEARLNLHTPEGTRQIECAVADLPKKLADAVHRRGEDATVEIVERAGPKKISHSTSVGGAQQLACVAKSGLATLRVNMSETRRPSENTEQGVPRPHHAEDTDPSQAAA